MRFSENRKIAWVVLAACVLVSVFGFGGLGLARERGKVLKVFDEGADTSLSVRSSMDAYLDGAAEAAQLMASEAALHAKGSAAIDAVSQSAAALADDSQSLDARDAAYTALKTDVDKLYNAMYEAAKGDDFKNFKVAYDDFWGYDDLIKHDEYHGLARAYNALAGGFPGSVVAALTGQGAMNTFGG